MHTIDGLETCPSQQGLIFNEVFSAPGEVGGLGIAFAAWNRVEKSKNKSKYIICSKSPIKKSKDGLYIPQPPGIVHQGQREISIKNWALQHLGFVTSCPQINQVMPRINHRIDRQRQEFQAHCLICLIWRLSTMFHNYSRFPHKSIPRTNVYV